ncbi:MAG: metal-dependent hydrolase [Polyangiaceae bacterium]
MDDLETRPNITVRRPRFAFPDGIDPILVEGEPEISFIYVAMSLLLPYLEPYLIRSLRAARKRVTDERLLSDIDLFNGQEGQHYREHMRFNEAVQMAGFEEVRALEEELSLDYERFTEKRSLRFNLAYAEGFEAYTMAVARFSLEIDAPSRMCGPARELFEWHLMEELEHRMVAFDVYNHVTPGYLYRLFVGLYAQWHLNRFVLRVQRVMLLACERGRAGDSADFERRYGGMRGRLRRTRRFLGEILRLLMPKVLSTYMPWYSPHRVAFPLAASRIAARLDAAQ